MPATSALATSGSTGSSRAFGELAAALEESEEMIDLLKKALVKEDA